MASKGLSVTALTVHYRLRAGDIVAADGVSFDVAPGERVGIVGESGSGKTTTALALMGMIAKPGEVVSGRAMLGNTDLLALGHEDRVAARLTRVSYIPQGAMNSLNPVQKVRQSILEGFTDHGQSLSAEAARDKVASLLSRVGLDPSVADLYPHELSGGMKQRVCIAVAVSMGPELLIADEPTSALDVITQRQVMRTLSDIQAELQSGLILIGHDMGLMAQFVDRLVVMKDGRVVEDGAVRPVFAKPAHAYTRKLLSSIPSLDDKRATTAPGDATHSDGTPLMRLAEAGKVYRGRLPGQPSQTALHPFSLDIHTDRPRIVSVVGQSGSGKTTLGALMLGFTDPSSGSVEYQGKPIASLSPAQRRDFRLNVQAVFQDPYAAFNPFYKVDHALTRPLKNFGLTRGRRATRERMEWACQAVGLDPGLVLGRFSHQLSGGQRQRLLVARALMLRPKLLIADEPVSMVDASLRASILANLRSLKDEHGITILYITHDLATAHAFSDYVIVLNQGRVAEAGDPQSVIGAPEHPYTKVLIDSIPWPDPDRKWGGAELDVMLAELNAAAGSQTIIRNQIPGVALG